jgi:hypothetical protein
VVLVVGVKDDVLVVSEALGYLGPPGAKVVCARDDVAGEAAIVVRVQNGICAPVSLVFDLHNGHEKLTGQ